VKARLLLLVVAAGGLLLSAAPQATAATPNGAWTDPSASGVYDGTPLAYLTAAQPLRGFAEFDQGIEDVRFTLLEDDDAEKCSAADDVREQHAGGGGTHVDFAFEADFPCNRLYAVRAEVTPVRRPLRNDSTLTLDLWVAVKIPPKPISSLEATELSGDERGVQLSWEPLTGYPDLEGYAVWRRIGDGEWTFLADTGPKVATYEDRVVPRDGGELSYKVFGMRAGPETDETVLAESSPTATVNLAAYVPPTTTPGEGEGGGGGGGDGGTTPSSIHVTGNQAPRVVSRAYPRTSKMTIDTGYEGTLPFPEQQTQQPQPTAPPSGNAIANLADDDDGSARRQTMLLVAGGTTTLSWALVLRYLTRRATTY
jgi:hypothetical protein